MKHPRCWSISPSFSISPDDLSHNSKSTSSSPSTAQLAQEQEMQTEPAPITWKNPTAGTQSMCPTQNGTVVGSAASNTATMASSLDPRSSLTSYSRAMHQHTERQMAASVGSDGRTNSGSSSGGECTQDNRTTISAATASNPRAAQAAP